MCELRIILITTLARLCIILPQAFFYPYEMHNAFNETRKKKEQQMPGGNGKGTNGKAPTKGEVLTAAAEATGLSRKQVSAVLDSMSDQIKSALSKKGPGTFVVHRLMRISVIQKPATPARKGINPFTKQEQMFKAKPARKIVKVRPLKNLREMVK